MDGEKYPGMKDINIETHGVEKLLKNINTKKACGPDMISNLVLKEYASEIAPVLSHIFQLSTVTGELPEDWRNANVSLIFKKGDRHTASNYRPVSLTCVCCKLLEHIVCRQILNHLEQNNILVFPPAPQKGMVKFSRKGHFQRAVTCKEGTFKRAATCKEGTFKPASLTFLQSYLLLPFFPNSPTL